MGGFTRWVIKWRGWVFAFGAILSVFAGYYALRLYGNLKTDLQELLPSNARSVRDLHEIKRRLPASTQLAVLVFSKHPQGSKRFVQDLAHVLVRDHALVTRVQYKVTHEIRFFERRQALFISVRDLRKIRDYIRRKIAYETALENPLNIFSGVRLIEPKLDFKDLERNYSQPVENVLHFPDGYFANPQQTIRVLLVSMKGDAADIARARLLRKSVDRAIASLHPLHYAPDLRIHYSGDVENAVEEQASLVSDLELSAAVVVVLVLIALLVFYRDLVGTFALVVSLVMGTVWTFGVSYFLVGYLNASSAFLGSIVLGNGINFGIIFLARYLENRRAGIQPDLALMGASVSTRRATLVAALGAGVSYGALMITPFRGFRQFGSIGLIGMVLCWISAYTMQPALLAILERHHRVGSPRPHRFARLVARLDARHYKAIAVFSMLLSAASIYSIASYHGKIIETDTTKLRDRRSMESGSGYYSEYLDRIFGRYLSPLVLLPRTHVASRAIRVRLNQMMAHQGKPKLIESVYSEDDFVPKNQNEKIRILRQIRNLLKPDILARLSPRDRGRVKPFLRPQSFHHFGVTDLPTSVKEQFRERNGSMGKIILVQPVMSHSIINDGDMQTRLLSRVRRAVDSVDPGTPIAGQLPLTVDMYHAVRSEGPRATWVAFLSVVLVVVLLFRNVKTITLALTALILGVLWFFGLIFAADVKINFLNFIALPITFGIGVDYGVNIFQRYRFEGPGRILHVISHTGGAVILASITTMIGYGSLMLAGSQAFVSFGRMAILGELTCVTAAVVALPAFLLLLNHREIDHAHEEMREAG